MTTEPRTGHMPSTSQLEPRTRSYAEILKATKRTPQNIKHTQEIQQEKMTRHAGLSKKLRVSATEFEGRGHTRSTGKHNFGF